jgi:replication initiation protein RepC
MGANSGSPRELCTRRFSRKAEAVLHNDQSSDHLPPALIVKPCPTVQDYSQPIRDIADIVRAERFLRRSLGAHEIAWKDAVQEVGLVKTAVAAIHVLQRKIGG